MFVFFFFSSRRRHTRLTCDWSSDVCSSDLGVRATGCAIRVPGSTTASREPVIHRRPAESLMRAGADRVLGAKPVWMIAVIVAVAGSTRASADDPDTLRPGGRGTYQARAGDRCRLHDHVAGWVELVHVGLAGVRGGF